MKHGKYWVSKDPVVVEKVEQIRTLLRERREFDGKIDFPSRRMAGYYNQEISFIKKQIRIWM